MSTLRMESKTWAQQFFVELAALHELLQLKKAKLMNNRNTYTVARLPPSGYKHKNSLRWETSIVK